MSLYERMEADFSFQDERGSLTQLVHQGWQQVNVLKSRGGSIRGGHYHKRVREAFFVVSGCVKLKLRSVSETAEYIEQTFVSGNFFLIPTGVVHCMFFPEDCILVALYDMPVSDGDNDKDIWPEEV